MNAPWLIAVLLTACGEPEADLLRDGPPLIDASQAFSVQLDAHMPSDVQFRADGGFEVLDGYAGRALAYDATHALVGPIGGDGTWGRPVRMTRSGSGITWLVEPHGAWLFRLDSQNRPEIELQINGPTDSPIGDPVAMLDPGADLFVADRHGALHWIDRQSGEIRSTVTKDIDEVPFGTITDLIGLADGQILGVDALQSKIHRFDAQGKPVGHFGRYGSWAGYLKKPVALAEGPDGTVLVADSDLRVVQLFDQDGDPLGVLSVNGELFRPAFPVAVERNGAGDYLVLDAGDATHPAAVWGFRLDVPAIVQAREEAATRWLRYPLIETGTHDPASDCVQCHAALINDSREVFDPKLGHHPVNVTPDRPIPAFFPVGPNGEIRCVTCHSPHGEVSLEEATAITDPEQRVTLVRHQSDHGEFFTRLSREDSSLCVACHAEDAHDEALARIGTKGGAHLVGKALQEALAKRPGGKPESITGGCLGCHAVHGADEDGLAAGANDGRVCGVCHEDKADPARSHPLGVRPTAKVRVPPDAGIPTDKRGGPACRSCHDLAGGREESLLRMPTNGGPLCMSCHTDKVQAMRRDHGRPGARLEEPCLACHDPHGGGQHLLTILDASSAKDPSGCLTCHGDGQSAARAGVRPGQVGHPVDGQAHGDVRALTCASCHDAHDPVEKLVACAKCHTEQGEAARRGGHGTATCVTCHAPHSAVLVANLPDVNPYSRRCLACHSESVGKGDAPKIAAFSHEAPMFTPGGARWTPLDGLPLFGPDGKPLPTGENGDLTCGSCHLTHGPDATRPGDSLRRPDWKAVCSACHGDDALALYRYFHQPDRRADIQVKP